MYKKIPLGENTIKIILLFLSWKIILIAISFFAVAYIPLANQDKFLGGGSVNFKLIPHLFSWANFDGEHYLSIAIFGYKGLEQAFFPIYPLLINLAAHPSPLRLLEALVNSTIAGLIISNASFLIAILYLFDLIIMDFSKKVSFIAIFLILIFPTSFYFGALYNESLFLLLTVLSFFNARRGNWFTASVFGMIACATRIFGILLLPAFLIEAYQQMVDLKKMIWIFLIPLGLGAYMIYQYLTVGDPLAFYHLQKLVGEQHQSGLTFLPQVYFRYLKMVVTVDRSNPIYQTILLELLAGIVFFILPIYGYFKKIRLSYLFYAMSGFLLPTIQGSFSSVPRYIIVFFPSFLALALFINTLPKILKISIVSALILLLGTETILFLRGYWVA